MSEQAPAQTPVTMIMSDSMQVTFIPQVMPTLLMFTAVISVTTEAPIPEMHLHILTVISQEVLTN